MAEEVAPLRDVPSEELAAMAGSVVGAGERSRLWLAVDGTVYDLTSFAGAGCPCGEVLRSWAGLDASEAFHAAGHHDSKVKDRMLQYMVGRLRLPPTEYRFGQHEEHETRMRMLMLVLALGGGAAFAAARFLMVAIPTSEKRMNLLELAFVALVLLMIGGFATTLLKFTTNSPPASSRLSSHQVALVITIFWSCLTTAGRRLVEGSPATLPTEFEVSGVGILILQAFLDFRRGRHLLRGQVIWSFIALLMVSATWFGWTSGTNGPQPAFSELALYLPETGAIAFGFACAAMLACAQAGGTMPMNTNESQGNSASVFGVLIAVATSPAFRFQGVYGLVGLTILFLLHPAAAETLCFRAQSSWMVLPCLVAASLLTVLSTACIFSISARCTSTFAARALAFAVATCGLLVVVGRVPGRSCLALVGLASHLAGLAAQNRDRLKSVANTTYFAELPPHVIGAQALWDALRVKLGMAIWKLFVLLPRNLLNLGLPRELMFFASEQAFPHLGSQEEDTHYGIAAYFAPPREGGHQPVPQHFVCNVGQIHASHIGDMQKTMNTLVDVWQEFQDPNLKGLISNVVAVFPHIPNQAVTKEINFSAWESAADAYNWYVSSPAHKNALFQHSSGILQTFGNLLASLQPNGDLDHTDRCKSCRRPVRSKEVGQLAPSKCGVCGGPTHRFPIF